VSVLQLRCVISLDHAKGAIGVEEEDQDAAVHCKVEMVGLWSGLWLYGKVSSIYLDFSSTPDQQSSSSNSVGHRDRSYRP
jgi:hypothetical protein